MRKSTRNQLIAFGVIVIVNALVYYERYTEQQRAAAPVELSDMGPDFTWQGLDGGAHKFSELAGHVVVLHFWAAWCGPCRQEFPELLAAAPLLKDDVVFLTVSGDEQAAQAKEFIAQAAAGEEKTPSNMLFAWDPQGAISMGMFQTALFPESIVVDATGHMRRKFIGPVAWKSKPVQDYLRQLKKKEDGVSHASVAP